MLLINHLRCCAVMHFKYSYTTNVPAKKYVLICICIQSQLMVRGIVEWYHIYTIPSLHIKECASFSSTTITLLRVKLLKSSSKLEMVLWTPYTVLYCSVRHQNLTRKAYFPWLFDPDSVMKSSRTKKKWTTKSNSVRPINLSQKLQTEGNDKLLPPISAIGQTTQRVWMRNVRSSPNTFYHWRELISHPSE